LDSSWVLALEHSCGAINLTVDDCFDGRERWHVGEDFDGGIGDDGGVFDLGSAQAGIVGESLGQDDGLRSGRLDEPFALGISAGTALVVKLDLVVSACGRVSFVGNFKKLRGSRAGTRGMEQLGMDASSGGKGCGELGGDGSEVDETGDGDDQSPLARAEVHHAVAFETAGARDSVLVRADAVVDAHQQHGRRDAALE